MGNLNPFDGGFLGKGGDETLTSEPRSSVVSSQIAEKLFKQTDPMRENIFGTLEDFTAGDFDISTSPAFAPGKMAIEDVFGTARGNVLANVPVGGQLTESLTDLETGRAKSLTDLIGGIQGDMFSKALSTATGVPQTSLAGLSSSAMANLQARQIGQQQSSAKMGMAGNLGMGIGSIIGGKDK